MISGNAQFGRAYSLLMLYPGGSGVDLSELHFKFSVRSMDLETPNTCTVRIYNLNAGSVANIRKGEFTQLVLSAGYQNGVNYGVIFKGDIKRVLIGRERNTDSYVEILAGDGDFAYNFATVSTNVGPGSSIATRFNAVSSSVAAYGVSIDSGAGAAFEGSGGILPQGAVLFGLFRSEMSKLAKTVNSRWSIQKGVLVVIQDTGYLPGETVVLNSQTGLIGTPEVTDAGINVRMLLNAKAYIGGLVNINQDLINKQIVQQQGYPKYGDIYLPAQMDWAGNYRVLIMNHTGDTRGQDWYTDIVCLALGFDSSGIAKALQYPG